MVMANSLNIGPKIIDNKKNFILMELIEGEKISTWMEKQFAIKGYECKKKTKKVLKDIMEQCYRLDNMYLDHGELTRIDNHVVVGENNVTILDFESSSINRKTANVTSITQSLVFGGIISKYVRDILDFSDERYELLGNLKKYKQEQNRQNFNEIVSSILGS
jgi:putative serine/threonine protein kinase